ncbi:MAG: GDP-mannose 4,6-dehydratase [Planctomycetota bacterium]
MQRVLITGGCGFIGSHLLRRASELGAEVHVLDDLSSGHAKNLPADFPQARIHRLRVQDLRPDHPALAGVDAVFHLAARPSVPVSIREPVQTFEVNVVGTHTLLAACREAGVRRVVFASSSSVYGDRPDLPKHEEQAPRPLSPYAAQKLAGEQLGMAYARSLGLEVVALRFFNVFGPRQDPGSAYAAAVAAFVDAALEGRAPTIYGDGEQTRDFTYVEDVVSACVQAATTPAASGEVFNVARGEQISVNALCRAILDLTGRADVSPAYAPTRAGDVEHSVASIAKAQRLLGWTPQISLEEGLRRTIAWAREVRASS